MYYLLTSPELGYSKVDVEKPWPGGLHDLYIYEIDLPIEIDGPNHYFNQSKKRVKSISLRRLDR